MINKLAKIFSPKFVKIAILSVLILVLGGLAYFGLKTPLKPLLGSTSDQFLGSGAYPDATWTVIKQFTGFQTKKDPSKVDDGANPQGQNTTVNDGDRISIRQQGYELFPVSSTYSTSEPIISLHNFRKRNGENIMIRTHGDEIDYFENGNDNWEVLASGFASADFDFADYNITTDQTSWTYFGNAYDAFSRWNGAHSLLTQSVSTGTDTIYFSTTTEFTNTGGHLILCGNDVSYTTTSDVFIKLNSTTTFSCLIGNPVYQRIETTPSNPRGNIYMVADNRLFIAGISTTPQAIYFSKYGDATQYYGASLIGTSTAASPGIFNLGEGGGAVSAMGQDEQGLYFFKRAIIYKATLSDALYSILPLKAFDGRSQTIGAINRRSVFSSGNQVFFITPDNQIMFISRIPNVDYPQTTAISDVIKPTVDSFSFSSSTGIVYKDKAYFAVKSDTSVFTNDTVLVYDIRNNKWDSPTVGWNVNDWTIYTDSADNLEHLYFGDGFGANVMKITNDPTDYIYDTVANWRSKQFDFGVPQQLKECDNLFIDGYMSPSTNLSISMLLDENGFTQKYNTTFKGAETNYFFNSPAYNLFGFFPFGFQRFGSNEDQSGKQKFRIYLNKNIKLIPFYTAQLEFASDGQNQNWEITNFALHCRISSQDIKTTLFRIFQ